MKISFFFYLKVCVSECPKENFYLKQHLNNFYDARSLRNKLICKDDFDKSKIRDKESAMKAVESKECAEWYLESKPGEFI